MPFDRLSCHSVTHIAAAQCSSHQPLRKTKEIQIIPGNKPLLARNTENTNSNGSPFSRKASHSLSHAPSHPKGKPRGSQKNCIPCEICGLVIKISSYTKHIQVHRQMFQRAMPDEPLFGFSQDTMLTSSILAAHREEVARRKEVAGLTPEEISRLPKNKFSGEEAHVEICCAVCHSDFIPNAILTFLPCMHYYHSDCIDDWLRNKCTCPICNSNIRKELSMVLIE